MTTSNSRLAFHDCIEAYDRALADDFGCRIKMKNYNAAVHFRMRLHTARNLDRRDNKQLYSDREDHPLYGRSVYDVLTCKLANKEGHWWVYIQKMTLPGEVEALSDLPEDAREANTYEEPQLEAAPQPAQVAAPQERLQIEHIRRRI
jgi:hypothetical protein